MDRNSIGNPYNLITRYFNGKLSQPLLTAWQKNTAFHPVNCAHNGILFVERNTAVNDALTYAIMVGMLLSFVGGLIGFIVLKPILPFVYTIGVLTVVGVIVAMFRGRSKDTDSYDYRLAVEFVEDHDRFLRITNNENTERFTKLKFRELQELAHAALAQYALQVREIEIAGEGISAIHWEQHKKDAAETLERVYALMRKFNFVGSEGYKPYYAMADELLKQKQPAA